MGTLCESGDFGALGQDEALNFRISVSPISAGERMKYLAKFRIPV